MSAPWICSPAEWPPRGLGEMTADDVCTEMAYVLPGAFGAAWSRRIRALHRGAWRFDAMPWRLEMLLHRHELARRGRRGVRGKRVLPYFASVSCALGAAEGWSSWNIDLIYAWANERDFLLEATPDPPGRQGNETLAELVGAGDLDKARRSGRGNGFANEIRRDKGRRKRENKRQSRAPVPAQVDILVQSCSSEWRCPSVHSHALLEARSTP
jgi:hypothetical protein